MIIVFGSFLGVKALGVEHLIAMETKVKEKQKREIIIGRYGVFGRESD